MLNTFDSEDKLSNGLISYKIEDALLIPNPRNRRASSIYMSFSALNKVVFVEGVCLNVAYIYCHFKCWKDD